MGSDAASERNLQGVDGESLWSSEHTVNGHSLTLPADHHNGYLKGEGYKTSLSNWQVQHSFEV